MMPKFYLYALALSLWAQGNVPPAALTSSNCFNAVEIKQLSVQAKIDGRVKVYRNLSERFRQAVQSAVSTPNYDEVPALVQCWKELLAVSLKDIEANINRKKKSGALIGYEIQLRKSIVDMGNFRLKVSFEQQRDFESWLSQAKVAHDRFVDILFQR
jgi:hypothetical protein